MKGKLFICYFLDEDPPILGMPNFDPRSIGSSSKAEQLFLAAFATVPWRWVNTGGSSCLWSTANMRAFPCSFCVVFTISMVSFTAVWLLACLVFVSLTDFGVSRFLPWCLCRSWLGLCCRLYGAVPPWRFWSTKKQPMQKQWPSATVVLSRACGNWSWGSRSTLAQHLPPWSWLRGLMWGQAWRELSWTATMVAACAP